MDPAVTVEGLTASEAIGMRAAAGSIVTEALAVDVPNEPVTVAVVAELTEDDAVNANMPCVEPAPIETCDGIIRAAGLVLLRVINNPPVGAGFAIFTRPTPPHPLSTVDGSRVSDVSVTGAAACI